MTFVQSDLGQDYKLLNKQFYYSRSDNLSAMSFSPKILIIILTLLAFNFVFTCAVTFEDDTVLTKVQGAALKKFKEKVIPKLKYDYQKEDLFLLRYLRAKKFDVNKAQNYLLDQMKWREENKMETILEEDWSDMKEYGAHVGGNDRDGRPLVFWDLGDWEIRKQVIAGNHDRIVRWIFRNWEDGRRQVQELERQGTNVTRWCMLVDLRNINAVTNVNAASLPFYSATSLGYDSHFPGMGDKIYLINTPGLFETVLAVLRPGLSQSTRDALQVYGKNEEEWKQVLHSVIDPSQLPQRYGGTKEDK